MRVRQGLWQLLLRASPVPGLQAHVPELELRAVRFLGRRLRRYGQVGSPGRSDAAVDARGVGDVPSAVEFSKTIAVGRSHAWRTSAGLKPRLPALETGALLVELHL